MERVYVYIQIGQNILGRCVPRTHNPVDTLSYDTGTCKLAQLSLDRCRDESQRNPSVESHFESLESYFESLESYLESSNQT